MVIVHVTRDVMSGGVGTVVRTLIREQTKQGYPVAVLSTQANEIPFANWKAQNGCENVRFYPIESYRVRYMTIWGELSSRTERKIRQDFPEQELVFHYHNPIGFGLLSKLGKGKKVCTIHAMLAEQAERISTKVVYWLTFIRMKYKNVTVVGCSRSVAEHCKTILHGIESQEVANGVFDPAPGINRYVGEGPVVRIGYVATIDALKGWRILAQAFDQLPEDVQNKACLFFAGGVSAADVEDFKEWISKSKNAKYIGKIGDVQTSFMPYIDVLVLPSRIEGMPMVILEAMQSRTCVIATAVGGIPEVIQNGENGILISRDADSLAQALERVILDPDLMRRLKKRGRDTYENKYTAEQMAEHYMKIYQS